MNILLDLDGVLADFEAACLVAFSNRYPMLPTVPLSERRNVRVRDDYPVELRSLVRSIYHEPGFFRHLPPIAGAIEAVRDLVALDHDVRICTMPLRNYRNCVLEKYEWVEEHLGSALVSRVIMSWDKTLIRGDVLVDDNPMVTGTQSPTWRHVIFDQPYNREAQGIRMDWSNWRDVLLSRGGS